MNKAKNIFIVFVIFALVGCAATLPPPKLLDPQRSAIGIVAKGAGKVYFIKVDEGKDLYTQGNFILSNYATNSQVYLLNAIPGRYVAVASHFIKSAGGFRGGGTYYNFFPKEVIKLTEVTVASGTIAFMGEYVLSTSWSWEDADDAQSHYFQLIAPGAKTGFLRGWISTKRYLKGSLRKESHDKQAEIRFLTNALEHFKDTDWINIIKKRMEALKAEK